MKIQKINLDHNNQIIDLLLLVLDYIINYIFICELENICKIEKGTKEKRFLESFQNSFVTIVIEIVCFYFCVCVKGVFSLKLSYFLYQILFSRKKKKNILTPWPITVSLNHGKEFVVWTKATSKTRDGEYVSLPDRPLIEIESPVWVLVVRLSFLCIIAHTTCEYRASQRVRVVLPINVNWFWWN